MLLREYIYNKEKLMNAHGHFFLGRGGDLIILAENLEINPYLKQFKNKKLSINGDRDSNTTYKWRYKN